jgi:trk system potassium uptake protein
MRRRLSWLLRLALLAHLTGALTVLLALTMLPSALVAWKDGSPDLAGQVAAIVGALTVGSLVFLLTRGRARGIELGHREGFLVVGVGWLMSSLVGALPYYLYAHLAPGDLCQATGPVVGADFCSFTNAAFESISGFTTTGASIITDGLWGEPGFTPDGRVGLPRGILLWRSMTHFLGGMGIIVLGVAILPLLGVGGMQLFKAEVPGPTTDKLAPRVGETAKLLWKVYLLLSTVQFILLAAGGMSAFEAVCHTMATMATGGFSTRASSAAGLQSPYAEWILTVFMYLAGINFTLHFAGVRGRLGVYFRDAEWRLYTAITVLGTGAATLSLWLAEESGMGFFEALRLAAFQVASILTTTGFASADFETWTYAPVALFVVVGTMFVGGMAGSTGGGVKVIRYLLLTKMWVRELFLLSHPRAVRSIRVNGRPVPNDVIRSVAAFGAVYIVLLTMGTGFFALDGQDLLTAATCSAASLGNIGPGLGEVGPYDNYAVLSPASKWVSGLLMLLGRLEIYTLLVLLTPGFWRR